MGERQRETEKKERDVEKHGKKNGPLLRYFTIVSIT